MIHFVVQWWRGNSRFLGFYSRFSRWQKLRLRSKALKFRRMLKNSLPLKISLRMKALNLSPSLLYVIYYFFNRTICTLCNYSITLHKPKKILSSWLINESILPATSLVLQLNFFIEQHLFLLFSINFINWDY